MKPPGGTPPWGSDTIVVELSPVGTCSIVDEPGAFIFDTGTTVTHSHHDDCVVKGLRIDTTFQVAGGVRAAAGASGSGRELGAVSMSAADTSFQRDDLLLRTGRLRGGAHRVRAGRIGRPCMVPGRRTVPAKNVALPFIPH